MKEKKKKIKTTNIIVAINIHYDIATPRNFQ